MIEINEVDVAIVGAGINGLVATLALAQLGLRVGLIEGRSLPELTHPEEYELRVSAITQASKNILQNLGVWNDIASVRVSPFSKMHVWDSQGQGEIKFSGFELGYSDLGYIVENELIRRCLINKIKTIEKVTVYCPCQLTTLQQQENSVYLNLESGSLLAAKLVIAADGGKSWVREQLGITCREWDYGQHALVAVIGTEKPHQQTAWQRFLPSGPLAFLPLLDSNQCSIVWSTTPEELQRLQDLNDAVFAAELGSQFSHQLGTLTCLSRRAAFPLTMRHASHYQKGRVALVGDAAHTIHPLAGQGVNLGMMDVAVLVHEIEKAVKDHQDFAAPRVLRRYERKQRPDNTLMLGGVECLKRLFSNRTPGLVQLRNIGLTLTNKAGPLKQFFIRQGMGLKNDGPPLAIR